jgi:hypothetical protein
MSSLSNAIARLHQSIVDGGDHLTILSDIVAEYGEESLVPLLTMPELPEGAIGEMYTLTHAVESFPDAVYVETLLRSIPRMSNVCPVHRDFLLARVVRSEGCFPILLRQVASLAPGIKPVLRSLLTKMAGDREEASDARKNCRAALKLVNR